MIKHATHREGNEASPIKESNTQVKKNNTVVRKFTNKSESKVQAIG